VGYLTIPDEGYGLSAIEGKQGYQTGHISRQSSNPVLLFRQYPNNKILLPLPGIDPFKILNNER